jgi:hypothetical protein
MLKENVKGVGDDMGANVFMRRVQGVSGWDGVGWFVDGKTKGALEEVELPC